MKLPDSKNSPEYILIYGLSRLIIQVYRKISCSNTSEAR